MDLDGIHGVTSKSGKVKLEKGLHHIEVQYFEASGGEELYVGWRIPGAKKETALSVNKGPSGGNSPNGQLLVVEDEARIYRNFIEGAGPRAIGVGYPGGINIAYDANNMRIALIWQGDFIDAKRHWNGRGQGFQPPSGQSIISGTPGVPFAVINSPSDPWPKTYLRKDNAQLPPIKNGYFFKGYQLSGKSRMPIFNYNFGQGDSDKDGIPDNKDTCPEEPGLKEFNGCPDTDGDKIPDNKDNCPEDFGAEIMNGCPDTDNDGVADKDDECPDQKGPIEFNGCPDSDEDGVADKDDECPKESGVLENKGCPWPDTDGDGVSDNEDACPEEVGSSENSGCPDLSMEVVETINQLASQINFAAGTDRIQGKAVLESLNEIKILLDNNPDGILIIEGHTSSDGETGANLELSQKRAAAVKAFLVNLGTNPERLITEGYGEERPVADNDTQQGRAQNRRVQFRTEF